MIAVDTNVLARFYCDDPDDPEAARQRPIAKKILLSSETVFVPITVILELEWVMRGFYETPPAAFTRVMKHLLGLANVTVEDWQAVDSALDLYDAGIDFADALHLGKSAHCTEFITFDDKRFAKKMTRASDRSVDGRKGPVVRVPK